MNTIDTVENEVRYLMKFWGKIDTFEKIILITILFLYFYIVILILSSYNKLSKSGEPRVGKAIFWLTLVTAIVMVLPITLHYVGISSYGIWNSIAMVGVSSFVLTLWLIFEFFEKRELDTDIYKDPYTMSLYFLLISFSLISVFANISKKM